MSEWHDEVEKKKMPDKIIYLFLIFFFQVKERKRKRQKCAQCRDEIRHHWGYNTAQAIKK